MEDDPRLHVETASQLEEWLAANHDTATGVWVVVWRSGTGRSAPTYEETTMVALRWGWIDSVRRRLDDERTMMRHTPRRSGSGWSAINKARIARLGAEGRLHPAGSAVIEAAKADGSWSLLDAVDALEVPDDLAAAFDAHPGARKRWDALPRSARRSALLRIASAKRPDTRARRVDDTAARAVSDVRG